MGQFLQAEFADFPGYTSFTGMWNMSYKFTRKPLRGVELLT